MDKQKYQMLRNGFSAIEDGVISLAKRFGKDIKKRNVPKFSQQSVDHQMYQMVDFGMRAIAEVLSEIDIEIKDGKTPEAGVDYPTVDQTKKLIEDIKPKKSIDYFTEEEIVAFTKKIQDSIRIPKDGETPVIDYDKIKEFVRKEVSQIPPAKDGEPGQDAIVDYDKIITAIISKIVVPAPEKVDYNEVKKLIKKELKDLPKSGVIRQFFGGGSSGGGGSQTLQQVTDNGATTTNRIQIGDVTDDTTSQLQVVGTTVLEGNHIEVDNIVTTDEQYLTVVSEITGSTFSAGSYFAFNVYAFKDTIHGRVYSDSYLDIGYSDNTEGIATFNISDGGSGNAIGDLLLVNGGNSDAYIKVTGVSGGAVTSAILLTKGSYYPTGFAICNGDFGATGTCEIEILTLYYPTTYDLQISFPPVAGATGYKIIINTDDTNGYYGDYSIESATSTFTYTGAGATTDITKTPSSPYYYTPALYTRGSTYHKSIITDAFRSSDSSILTDPTGFAWGAGALAGFQSFAQGFQAQATNGYDIAMGSYAQASGGSSVAIGTQTYAYGNASLAMRGGRAYTVGSIAIGGLTNYGGVLAIGSSSAQALNTGACSFGAFGNTYPYSLMFGGDNQIYQFLHLRPSESIQFTNLTIGNATGLGTEKITNGTFNTNTTGWTLASGFTYNSSTKKIDIDTVNFAALTQSSATMVTPIVAGETYVLSYQITNLNVGGKIQIECGGVQLAQYVSSSTIPPDVFTAVSTGDLKFTAYPNTTGSIDNISLKKVENGDLRVCGTAYSKSLKTGGLTLGYVAKTANYTVLTTDYLIDCTANTFTVTLPTAVGITGQEFKIKNSGSGVITVATTSSQTIDGVTTQTVNSPDSMTVTSTGSNWIIT